MYSELFERDIREAVEPVLGGMGFSLVELAIGRRKGSTLVSLVIFRKEGVGVDQCAEVSNLLFPRLQTIEGLEDVSLQVSSPGIERTIRAPAEYEIFKGKGVRILSGNETEWSSGIIERVEDGTLWLRKGAQTRGFALAEIRKARLDYSVEAEEKNAV